MEMSYKRFITGFSLIFIVLAVILMGLVYVSDPYVYYHKEGIYKRTFIKNFNMRYQMAGMIRNLDYDTVFIGTSMAHNFKEETIDRKLDAASLNASISGSSAHEQKKAAELAVKSKDIKKIYWEINYDSLAGEPDRKDATFPEYLYDRNIINDLPYLLSYDALKKIDYQYHNQEAVNMDADPRSYYKFGEKKPPLTVSGMKEQLEGISAPPAASHNRESYLESFRANMLSMAKKHPDIEFTFFYTPYPITRHVVVDEGKPVITADRLQVKKDIFKELDSLGNVEVYDFQDESEITFNVSNYMDRSHYFPYVNDWMLDEMSKGNSIKTMAVYDRKISNMREQIKNFKYAQLKENSGETAMNK
ncbi:MAG: hypothetical protein ACQEUD_19725 [Bacillota bacterium]